MSDPNYRNIPALAAYIERVGAEELNFRRFMVKEHKGEYYIERSLILIGADGVITCSNKQYAPTDEERSQIQGALMASKFPRSIGATKAQVAALRRSGKLGAASIIYELISPSGDFVMVQERMMKDGKKHFRPWTFWSDGTWRPMEPEGNLPFWRPGPTAMTTAFMIHEGAKAAKAANDLINDPVAMKAHPWGKFLSLYEHWGMIGGALAPHRADYASLVAEKPSEVIYFCDNDHPGKAALQEVSRHYGRAMKGIKLDGRWPQGWDMAELMPKRLFAPNGRYVGPPLKQMMKLATRATEVVPNPAGRGRSLTLLMPAFAEEWYHCATPEVFVHRDWSNRIYTIGEFNNIVKPFSDVDDTARLLKSDDTSKSTVLKYTPAHGPGVYGDESGRFLNTHCPSDIEPEAGDATPFLYFMEHLVPDQGDRMEVLRWIATLIARPDVKMLYGVLMISEMQGVGKGTLGEKILAPLVGEANVSYPSEKDIVEGTFNYWCAHKRLAIVHEIYAGQSSKAYNMLKSIITDKSITVNKKFQSAYEIENWMHVFACSNSMRAIKLSMDDRRWYVPKITEEKQTPEYWSRFNRWLNDEGGLGIISWWAKAWIDMNGPVERGAGAPFTELKKEIVEEGWSPGQILVSTTLDRLLAAANGDDPELRDKLERSGFIRDNQIMVFDTDLVQMIREVIYDGRPNDRLERPLTVRKVAKAKGWFVNPKKSVVRWLKRGLHSSVICSTKELAARDPSDIYGIDMADADRIIPVDLTMFRGL